MLEEKQGGQGEGKIPNSSTPYPLPLFLRQLHGESTRWCAYTDKTLPLQAKY